ncbi:MAG: class I tRNA ligase family protein [Candidatus Uhrbacteria bacterium]
MRYDHKSIERKWQERWERDNAFTAQGDGARPKWYGLVEFPYPSGEGLHVGHLRSYTAMDIIARKRRMEGYDVLYPIGWDAFGLPAENYAIKTGRNPRDTTAENCANFRRQLKAMGFSFDWSREINTTDPAYYKWTQWIFLKLFEYGLAYKAEMPINWCPACRIGLANEEAIGGVCERCGGPVEKRNRRQWMLRITKYAEKLLAGLDTVDYIERAKVQQRNWIGRSEGATITFDIIADGSRTGSVAEHPRPSSEDLWAVGGPSFRVCPVGTRSVSFGATRPRASVPIFTTRPDTLFGATYLVLAPEHPFIEQLLTGEESPTPFNSPSRGEGEKKDDFPISQGEGELEIISPPPTGRGGEGGWGGIENADEVRTYIAAARRKTDIERTNEEKEKTGVELKGIRAINPANGEKIPIWIADYVLAHYGTGAIMAVPAHDERDFAFAQKYGLPIREVINGVGEDFISSHRAGIKPAPTRAYTGGGILVASGKFTGMSFEEAKRAITEHVGGEMTVTYKLRDWVFSRQRYWGEPIPIVFCAECARASTPSNSPSPGEGEKKKNFPTSHWPAPTEASGEGGQGGVGIGQTSNVNGQASIFELIAGIPHAIIPIPEDQLPVLLPEVEHYQPTDTGDSPLAGVTDWVNTKCPRCGGPAKRETDVMPNWAGSSWYYFAYLMRGAWLSTKEHSYILQNVRMSSSDESLSMSSYQDAFRHWLPVDWYNGGMEHTTLHLLYSRFWNLFLHDIGVVPEREPYKKRTSHGLVLATDGEKMSKSRGNVVNPDEIIEKFGADVVRVYEMFIGPFDQPVPWSTDGLVGCRRFLEKVAALAERVDPDERRGGFYTRPREDIKSSPTNTDNDHCAVERLLHRTIKKVTDDIEAMRFNTAVSALMILTNEFTSATGGSASGGKHSISPDAYRTLLVLLSPFAPHLCEELWEELQRRGGFYTRPREDIKSSPTAARHSEPRRKGQGEESHTIVGGSVFAQPWPSYDPALIIEDEIDLVIQVNGKLRATIRVPADITEADATAHALVDANVMKHLAGKNPKKIIFVPGKLISIVV